MNGALIFPLFVRNHSSSLVTGDSTGRLLAPIRQELVECARVDDGARNAVIADFGGFLDDEDLEFAAACLCQLS